MQVVHLPEVAYASAESLDRFYRTYTSFPLQLVNFVQLPGCSQAVDIHFYGHHDVSPDASRTKFVTTAFLASPPRTFSLTIPVGWDYPLLLTAPPEPLEFRSIPGIITLKSTDVVVVDMFDASLPLEHRVERFVSWSEQWEAQGGTWDEYLALCGRKPREPTPLVPVPLNSVHTTDDNPGKFTGITESRDEIYDYDGLYEVDDTVGADAGRSPVWDIKEGSWREDYMVLAAGGTSVEDDA